jgi:hypothetical protein
MYRSWKAPCFILTALWDGFLLDFSHHNHAQTCTTWRPVLKCPLPIRNHDGRLSIEESEAEDGAWWQQMVLFWRCLFVFPWSSWNLKKTTFFYLSNISPPKKNTRFSIFFSRWFGLLNGCSHYGQPPAQSSKSQVTSSWNGANAFPQSMDGPEL